MTLWLPDTQLPALEPLLSGRLWNQWHTEGLVFPVASVRGSIRYVRLKPGVSCRLTVFAEDLGRADEPPQGFLIQLYPDGDRARSAYEKECTRRHVIGHGGFEPFLWEDPAAVGIPFPNDPDLPDLRHVFQPDRFRRTLQAVLTDYPEETWRVQRQLLKTTLLRYIPGRRAVMRLKVKLRRRAGDEKVRVRFLTKVETRRSAERSFDNASLIAAACDESSPWGVPRPQGFVRDRAFTANEWVEGTSLLADSPWQPETFRRVGRALASFHRIELDLEHLPSPLEEAERLVELGSDLSQLLPDDESRIRELAERLARALAALSLSPSSIVHGDLRLDQVLLAETRPVFVDLDGAGRGYAASDVGSFLAHLEELSAPPEMGQAFRDGYAEGEPLGVDLGIVGVTTAASLFRRTVRPFRELQDDWPQRTRDLIARTERILAKVDP